MGSLASCLASLRTWSVGRWATAAAVSLLVALAIGIPTGIVRTSFYTRMTAVTWWDIPIWALTSLLAGLTAATYLRQRGGAPPAASRGHRSIAATVGSAFAVGCPICNKLVVAVLGVSGALSYWAPLQPALGVVSVGLLTLGLVMRLRGEVSCRPRT